MPLWFLRCLYLHRFRLIHWFMHWLVNRFGDRNRFWFGFFDWFIRDDISALLIFFSFKLLSELFNPSFLVSNISLFLLFCLLLLSFSFFLLSFDAFLLFDYSLFFIDTSLLYH